MVCFCLTGVCTNTYSVYCYLYVTKMRQTVEAEKGYYSSKLVIFSLKSFFWGKNSLLLIPVLLLGDIPVFFLK